MSLFEKIYITLPSIFKSLIPKDASYFFFQKDICQNFKIWSEHIQQFNSTLIWGLNFSSRQLHFLHAKFTLPSPIDHMFQRSGSCASVAKHNGCFIHLVPMLGCPWPCFQLFSQAFAVAAALSSPCPWVHYYPQETATMVF